MNYTGSTPAASTIRLSVCGAGSLEPNLQLHPCSARRTGREECRALDGRTPREWTAVVRKGKRVRLKCTLRGQRRIGKLRRRVVFMIEKIIDLHRQLQAPREIVMRAKVCDRVARRNARPEIEDTVGFVCIILVPARIRTRRYHLIEIDRKFGRNLEV